MCLIGFSKLITQAQCGKGLMLVIIVLFFFFHYAGQVGLSLKSNEDKLWLISLCK